MPDINDIWDDEEDNEMMRRNMGISRRVKSKPTVEERTKPETADRIFLVPFGGDGELMWSTDGDSQYDPSYVREDIHRARIEALEAALRDARDMLEGEPEYHYQGMGCGLEDRCITDRYKAMEYGWDQAMGRVYGEHINHAKDLIDDALTGAKP